MDLGSETKVDVELEGEFKVEVVLCHAAVSVSVSSPPPLSLYSCLSSGEMARLSGLSELSDLELGVGLSRTVLDPRLLRSSIFAFAHCCWERWLIGFWDGGTGAQLRW